MKTQHWKFAPVALLIAGLIGCGDGGPKTAPVHGRITYKGKPVPNGSIVFIPKSGPPASADIDSEGKYALKTFKPGDGAVLGTHEVMITALQDMKGRLPEDRTPLPPPIVPSRYGSTSTSGLTAEVKDEDNTVNFELTDEKDPPKK